MAWLELSVIANKRVMLGLGALLVCLEKRGTQNAPEYVENKR